MDTLLFGISGLPFGDGTKKLIYKSGIEYLKKIGLDAMELPFVRSVNVTDKNKDDILTAKATNKFYLSAHGSYFVNLNADEQEKQEKSMERIIKGAEGLKKVEGRSLVFHPGFYLKDSKEETFETIKNNLLKLPDLGVHYRLETTGKSTQFGSLEENVQLCKAISTCKLCIDFSHLHARYNGCLKTYDDFARILDYVGCELGDTALKDMHIHMSGINYTVKGERNHLPFEESDFNYKACLESFHKFNIRGCIICESPFLEKDALLLKNYYESL
ncbi:TIM barrel protein [Clostridium aestuarii]|uniref:TIM barrel protein n=1 Tax=Clostridium aestuarii TaxID=338193 RepID=A0ABT4CZH6_9CLOT|nr:TIM barrel protein [Clostridium aestuarii]MCY6483787.1 TIM barrel protein [Clostridium aestuarii]